MLRAILIYLSKAPWAKRVVTRWKIARRVASRFIAGEHIEDAVRAIRALNAKGIYATLVQLGEHTDNREKALRATQDILNSIQMLVESGVLSNISLKLTQIGMAVDDSLCEDNLIAILTFAKEQDVFVRIDIEDSKWVDKTLGLCHRMRSEYGFENVGVAIQAYLYRSEKDIRVLTEDCTRVRLCKGAYKEPPDIAFPKKKDVDANFDRLTDILLDCAVKACAPVASSDGRTPAIPAIASHDEQRIEHAQVYAQKIGLPKQALEFQMLNGIRRDLQEKLATKGYPVRIYVPFGTEWYPYFMRRLAERPANLWFFVSNFFRK